MQTRAFGVKIQQLGCAVVYTCDMASRQEAKRPRGLIEIILTIRINNLSWCFSNKDGFQWPRVVTIPLGTLAMALSFGDGNGHMACCLLLESGLNITYVLHHNEVLVIG